MLSPGECHRHVPKDLRLNLLYRRWLLKQCDDPKVRRGVMELCRQDIFYWINSFAWQYNPDTREIGPFITWDRAPWLEDIPEQESQEEAIWEVLDAVESREDVRWQKSREVGASWLVLLIIDWLCLFHPNVKALVMSRDEDAVDRADDPDSLFWKLRFINKFLPDWMRGPLKGKERKDARPGIKDRSMGFLYERTGSTVTGEANVTSAGVGGRATIMLVDEFGQFRNGAETYSMTSDTCNCRVFVFTHKDNSGMAYELCFDAKYTAMREIVTHWSQHPVKGRGLYRYNENRHAIEILDKTYPFPEDFKFVMEPKPTGGPFPGIRSPWYDKQCIRRTDRDISMNLDIDPRGATDRFFDSYRIGVLKAAFGVEPYWQGNLKYNKETGRPLELVEDSQGLIKLWCHPRGPVSMPVGRTGGGLDIAAGSGMTPSCISIMSARTGEKLLEYANANIYQNDFAVLVAAICRMFEDMDGITTLLGWELQGSSVVNRKLIELGYSPCYVRRDEDALGKPYDAKGRYGIHQAPAAILAVMNDYRDALYEQRCINRSAFALEECLQFVYTPQGVEYRGSKKPKKVGDEGSGARIHHGDMPKADAIAWKMVKELGFERAVLDDGRDKNWIDPRTMEGRLKIAQQDQEADDFIWV